MKFSRQGFLALSLLVLAPPSWADAQEVADSEHPAVFVQLDKRLSDELSGRKRKELTDSVRDIEEQIGKRPSIRLAKKREDASAVVRVLDRRIEMNTTGQTDYGGSYTQKQYQSRYVLAYRVDSDGRSFETETALAGAFVTWKRVAGTVAKDVELWIHLQRRDSFDSDRP